MRRASRVDANHGQIRDGLRKLGVWVADTSRLGDGFPDLLAYLWRFVLLEVKDGTKIPSERALSPREEAFFAGCPGPIYLVNNLDEAYAAVRRRP